MSTEQVGDVGGDAPAPAPAPASLKRQQTDGNMNDSFTKEAKRVGAALVDESEAERMLTVGQHFGEVGVLLPQTPCIATVVAQAPTTLLVLDGESSTADRSRRDAPRFQR